jgi:hypothetical protein
MRLLEAAMTGEFGLLGVPLQRGRARPRQEKAPAALRRAGLAAAGVRVGEFLADGRVLLGLGIAPVLLYMDGGVDLFTAATNPTGILDSMAWPTCWTSPGPPWTSPRAAAVAVAGQWGRHRYPDPLGS